MKLSIAEIKNLLLDILFPKFCFGCQKEGILLCQDCQSVLGVNKTHQKYSTGNLSDLYFALPYQKGLTRNLIRKFKYKPFVKELSQSLTSLIVEHLQLVEKESIFFDFVIVPIPLQKRRLRWRGFNQARELGQEIAKFLKIPLFNDVLVKNRETLPQVELSEEKRKENVKEVFSCQNPQKIQERKILLIDDVYTTGSTMEEAARILKQNGAKEIVGLVVVRAEPKEDSFDNI